MNKPSWRHKLHEIIFEADTPAGKAFDVVLLLLILLSIIVVMLESVKGIGDEYPVLFRYLEWILTGLFALEYILRIVSVEKPQRYIFSFYGIVDLLSILPFFVELIFAGTKYLIVVRSLRLLRVFRILKLAKFMAGGNVLGSALRASRAKITVFLIAVGTLVLIIGTIMYMIEGDYPESGFSDIPRSVYWAIVTVTTVGYGDIAPVTALGQFMASILMILGYGIIAVPTGIVSVELAQVEKETRKKLNTKSCPVCSREGHDMDAIHCKYCGGLL